MVQVSIIKDWLFRHCSRRKWMLSRSPPTAIARRPTLHFHLSLWVTEKRVYPLLNSILKRLPIWYHTVHSRISNDIWRNNKTFLLHQYSAVSESLMSHCVYERFQRKQAIEHQRCERIICCLSLPKLTYLPGYVLITVLIVMHVVWAMPSCSREPWHRSYP